MPESRAPHPLRRDSHTTHVHPRATILQKKAGSDNASGRWGYLNLLYHVAGLYEHLRGSGEEDPAAAGSMVRSPAAAFVECLFCVRCLDHAPPMNPP